MGRQGLDLIQGTLEFLVLQALASGEARHGFGVLRWIADASGGALNIEEGALYPALHRMERRGWLQSEWGLSESNRKARYYTLTRAGRAHLSQELASWQEYVEVVSGVIEAAGTAPA